MNSRSALPYYETCEFATTLRGQAVRFISKPGMPHWDHISPATRLLAEAIQVPAGSRVLVLGCGPGALGIALGGTIPGGDIRLADTNFVALNMAERTIRANNLPNVSVDRDAAVLPDRAQSFDAVAVELPGGRKLARRWLLAAHEFLRPGGDLYLAGPNNEGIQSVVDDARDLFGNVVVLGYKERNRVARARKGSSDAAPPAWTEEPGIAPGTWYELDVHVRNLSFHLRSLPGVFAFDKLDDGTSLLLSALDVPQGSRVLDIGCGYGIIGLVAARLGAGHVDMVDVNLLAIAAVHENITRNAIANASAFPSDVAGAVTGQRYDLIVSNPPFHAGKAVDYDVATTIIEDARRLLNPDGRLILVANRFIRYDRLMATLFKRVHVLAENSRFHVLAAV